MINVKQMKLTQAVVATVILMLFATAATSQEDTVMKVSTLNGHNGYKVIGETENNFIGGMPSRSDSVGDFNGDGFNDFMVSSALNSTNLKRGGASYLIFGTEDGFPALMNLAHLNGLNGFVLYGVEGLGYFGSSISSTGDFNGDGFDDIIIGAPGEDTNGQSAGAAYVLFGTDNIQSRTFDLTQLDGNNGFVIRGQFRDHDIGTLVAQAGDINGDGFDDIYLSSREEINDIETTMGYVIYGHDNLTGAEFNLSLINGSNGFKLHNSLTTFGNSIGKSGDVNADGVDDLMIGYLTASHAGVEAGVSYVLFGNRSGFDQLIDLSTLNGQNGFALFGEAEGDASGASVSVIKDFNGDGIDDMCISAPAFGTWDFGRVYVIFGQVGPHAAAFDLTTLNGFNGFAIDGRSVFENVGHVVKDAGDINGDGLTDTLISSEFYDIEGVNDVGLAYVLYGSKKAFPSAMSLNALNRNNGKIIHGAAEGDQLSRSFAGLGDVNNDGLGDFLITAPYADTDTLNNPGAAYVVFGSNDLIYVGGFE